MSPDINIQVFDNIIPEKMLCDVLDTINEKGFQYGWRSNRDIQYGHWNLSFSKTGLAFKNRKDIKDELPPVIKRLWEEISSKVLVKCNVLLRAYCNAHTYGTEGYVHEDSKVRNDLTLVIYLNRLWEVDWAGETVFFQKGEIIKAVVPKWKRVLLFSSNVKHAARGVSRFCPEARLVLVFKCRKSTDSDEK